MILVFKSNFPVMIFIMFLVKYIPLGTLEYGVKLRRFCIFWFLLASVHFYFIICYFVFYFGFLNFWIEMLFHVCKFLFNCFKFTLEQFWFIFLYFVVFVSFCKYFDYYFLFYPYNCILLVWPAKISLFLNVLGLFTLTQNVDNVKFRSKIFSQVHI